MPYKTIIGLEVHLQLTTETKIFCACPASASGELSPNSSVCPVCLGLPGSLPVLNEKAVDFAIMMALAFDADILPRSDFYRKNYFYPDLPKGYQITQHALSLAVGGVVEIQTDKGPKKIRLIEMHLEEDAGKSIHNPFKDVTLVDFNRCGIPLLEVVSAPDLNSPEEAVAYASQLKQTAEFLGICAGRMEEGNFRVDANVNIELPDGKRTPRSEIKNLNSFRFMARALEHEVSRHIEAVEKGEVMRVETRLFDERTGETRTMRVKEEESDYRYFPEPDLPPLCISKGRIELMRESLPEMPEARARRFLSQYNLSEGDARNLCAGRSVADYFEAVANKISDPKKAANWILSEVFAVLNSRVENIEAFAGRVPPESLAELLRLLENNEISGPVAKDIFAEISGQGGSPSSIVQTRGLAQLSDDDELRAVIGKIIEEHPDEVARYKSGKEALFGFFVGQTMKATRGKANPKIVEEILKEILRNR